MLMLRATLERAREQRALRRHGVTMLLDAARYRWVWRARAPARCYALSCYLRAALYATR